MILLQRPTLDLLFQLPLSSDVLQPVPGCRVKSGRKFTGLRPAESVRDLVLRPERRPDRVRDHDRLHDREVPDEGRKDCHSSLAVRPGKTGHGNGQIDQDKTSESLFNVWSYVEAQNVSLGVSICLDRDSRSWLKSLDFKNLNRDKKERSQPSRKSWHCKKVSLDTKDILDLDLDWSRLSRPPGLTKWCLPGF